MAVAVCFRLPLSGLFAGPLKIATGYGSKDRVRGNCTAVPVCPQNRAYGSVHGSSCRLYPPTKTKPMGVLFV